MINYLFQIGPAPVGPVKPDQEILPFSKCGSDLPGTLEILSLARILAGSAVSINASSPTIFPFLMNHNRLSVKYLFDKPGIKNQCIF
jgi:hypothetical protein